MGLRNLYEARGPAGGVEAVDADTPAGKRLEETRRFYEFLHSEIPLLMQMWRKRRSESTVE